MTDLPSSRRWGALPTKVVTIDLADGVPDLPGLDGFVFALVVVLVGGEPLGVVRVPVEGVRCPAEAIAAAVRAELGDQLLRVALLAAMSGSPTGRVPSIDDLTLNAPRAVSSARASVTVAVCTRDRPDRLRRCLEAVCLQRTPARTVLVVDNAPTTAATARLVAERFPGIEYLVEPRPGLDHARNRALAECTTDVLVYTDDDAVPDERWTSAIATAFDEEPNLAMVTGLVLPYALDTPAQQIFERLGGFGRGFRRRWVSVAPGHAGRRLGAGEWGTGANMAFSRAALERIGGFDPALDVGTPTGGGGDHDAFHRVLSAGLLVCYEPGAIVFHEHRESVAELTAQIRNNGSVWSMMAAARAADRASVADIARVLRWYATERWPRELVRAWLIPNRVPLRVPAAEVVGFGRAALRRDYRRSHAVNGSAATPPAAPVPTVGRDDEAAAVPVVAADVAGPPPKVGCGEAVVLLTRGPRAIGRLVIPAGQHPWSARAWREAVVDECGIEVLASCDRRAASDVRADAVARVRAAVRPRDGGHAPGRPPCSASIVIATLDRPDDLAACLEGVVGHDSRHPFDVVVVDNNPASGLTRPVCERFPGVRRVVEERRGLAYARNAGILSATGDVVVTTDDDVRVPVGWLDLLLDPFRRNDVMAVCGNVQPLELRTPAQLDFERISPLSKGFRRFESQWAHPTKPWTAFPAWELGATANAAFRRVVFDDPEVGLMDEALGPGMPSGVGEDSYLLYRIVRAGWTVVYEPTAYVWHRHRDTAAALVSQITNYYSGHVAHQLTTLVRDHDPRAVHRIARVTAYATVSRLESLVGRGPVPSVIARAQLSGTLRGPLNYVRSQRRVRREGRSAASAGDA